MSVTLLNTQTHTRTQTHVGTDTHEHTYTRAQKHTQTHHTYIHTHAHNTHAYSYEICKSIMFAFVEAPSCQSLVVVPLYQQSPLPCIAWDFLTYCSVLLWVLAIKKKEISVIYRPFEIKLNEVILSFLISENALIQNPVFIAFHLK